MSIRNFLYKATISEKTLYNFYNWLELQRQFYNVALEQRIDAYKKQKKFMTLFDQQYQLKGWAKEFTEYQGMNVQSMRMVLERIYWSYKSFFRKNNNGIKAGLPRFRGKGRFDSIQFAQSGWELKGRYLYIKNIGRFKLNKNNILQGRIKHITIRKTSTNKIFVTFTCDDVPQKIYPVSDKKVGLDVGLKHFVYDSDGKTFENPRYFQTAQKKLAKAQRIFSRKKKGSKNREKARLAVAKIYEKIVNQRKDFQHKVSHYYAQNYGTIVVEDLDIKGLTHNNILAFNICDAGWGGFLVKLSYKAEEAGRMFYKVPPQYTSQECSSCGKTVKKSLSTRTHRCECGLVLDRDYNAAINILNKAGGRTDRPGELKSLPQRSEAGDFPVEDVKTFKE